MTHAYTPGNVVSLRKKEIKYVPGSKELYNLNWDHETQNVSFFFIFLIFINFKNLYNNEDKQELVAEMDLYMNNWLEHIEKRNIATENGRVKDLCYPKFKHSTLKLF